MPTCLAFRGVPTFFRACCLEAARRKQGLDYSNAGYHLMLHASRLVPNGCEADEWDREIKQLHSHLEHENVAAVLAWLVQHFPKCLKLVPPRRRLKFVEGVFREWLSEMDEYDPSEFADYFESIANSTSKSAA